MSTKIYNGFRWKGAKSLDYVYRSLPALRESVVKLAAKESARTVIKVAVDIYDKMTLHNDTTSDSALGLAYSLIEKQLEVAKETNSPCVFDFGFNICLGITSDKNVIGMYFSGVKEMRDGFLTIDCIEDYHYQTVTDRPRNVSEARWNKRRQHWNEILEGSHIPAQRMLTYTIIPDYTIPIPDETEMENYIPSFSSRLLKNATAVTLSKACEEGLDNINDMTRYIIGNSSFSKRLEEETARLSNILKHDLTFKDLTRKNNGT